MNIHELADVDVRAFVGNGTNVWRWTCIREVAYIGRRCNIGQHVYIDVNVTIGNDCKIQNGCNIYEGAILRNGVFLGPGVTFTNVKKPKALSPTEEYASTIIERETTIGARSILVCGVHVGANAFVGAGSLVTKDVPAYALAFGHPARVVGISCKCGELTIGSKVCKCGKSYDCP